MRPSGPVRMANSPMAKQPDTLAVSVPQGKISLVLRAIVPDTA